MRQAMAEKPDEFDPRAFLKAAVTAARDYCQLRFDAFGSVSQASRLKPIPLERMANAYRSATEFHSAVPCVFGPEVWGLFLRRRKTPKSYLCAASHRIIFFAHLA